MFTGSELGAAGAGYVLIRDAIKSAAPEGLPYPAAIVSAAQDEAPVDNEADAEAQAADAPQSDEQEGGEE